MCTGVGGSGGVGSGVCVDGTDGVSSGGDAGGDCYDGGSVGNIGGS